MKNARPNASVKKKLNDRGIKPQARLLLVKPQKISERLRKRNTNVKNKHVKRNPLETKKKKKKH